MAFCWKICDSFDTFHRHRLIQICVYIHAHLFTDPHNAEYTNDRQFVCVLCLSRFIYSSFLVHKFDEGTQGSWFMRICIFQRMKGGYCQWNDPYVIYCFLLCAHFDMRVWIWKWEGNSKGDEFPGTSGKLNRTGCSDQGFEFDKFVWGLRKVNHGVCLYAG